MKIATIAWKDFKRSLRTTFLVVMMFVLPLLITGLIYLAFGRGSGDGGITLPSATVLVVNQDHPAAGAGLAAGALLAEQLTGEAFAGLFDAVLVEDEAEARAAVEDGRADMVVLIPAEFTAAVAQPQTRADVLIYHHPDMAVVARVVKIVTSDFVDGFAGAKIAVHVATHQLEDMGTAPSPRDAQAVAQSYAAWLQADHTPRSGGPEHTDVTPLFAERLPSSTERAASQATMFLGPVMSGLMVFFMFYTAAAASQSILYEQQEGTLARLFTTPTPRWAILAGKLGAVVVTVGLQAVVLLLAAALIFGIEWGATASVVVLTASVVIAASGFGILLISIVRSPRQAGPVTGLVVTVTGLMGGLMPSGDPSQPPAYETFTLALPQGWAQHGWRLVLAGGSLADVWLPVTVLVLTGVFLFGAGAFFFNRRFAGGA